MVKAGPEICSIRILPLRRGSAAGPAKIETDPLYVDIVQEAMEGCRLNVLVQVANSAG